MSLLGILFRNLAFYRRQHLGVALGSALCAMVLIGALTVGDSVRATLSSLAEERIGKGDLAMLSPDGFFKEDLAERIAGKKNCEKKESRYECNSREYPKRIANYRRYIKTAIEDLEYTKVKRRSMAVEYNSLFKKACQTEKPFEMYEKLK